MSAESNAAADALQNSLFLRACRREATERTPIWLMRQAGRYMKDYRALRARVSFLDLCKNSALAAEVTVDAAHRLGVDAAIIFSDILVPVEPLGYELAYDPAPVIANPFRNEDDLRRMDAAKPVERLEFVCDAIRLARRALRPDLPLIGFVGAPFTVASYLIEGRTSKNHAATKRLMLGAPDLWAGLMGSLSRHLADFVNAQIEAGVQAVQVFDSWAGSLSPDDYRSSVLPYTRRLIAAIRPGTPVINFATGTAGMLSTFRDGGGDVFGLDWRMDLDAAWKVLGDAAVMGNLDPAVLLTDPKTISARARRILDRAAGRPGHIFNLGHGVLPETPIENVLALVETVKASRPSRPKVAS